MIELEDNRLQAGARVLIYSPLVVDKLPIGNN